MTPPAPNDDELDPLLREAVQALRAPVMARAAARESLRAALADAAGPARTTAIDVTPTVAATPPVAVRRRRPLGWFTGARVLRVSPAGLLAAASLLIAATATITATLVQRATPIATAPVSPAPRGTQVVRFSLAAPQAHQVSLVGDFNGWDPAATALQLRDGTWTVVIPVTPGRHQYGFVVDGTEWIADPAAARTADTDFGSANSVVYVGS